MCCRKPESRCEKFANLKLEFTRVNLLTTSWTIVHPIDDESPMLGWSADDFVNNRTELLVLLQAYEETFANNVHSAPATRPMKSWWAPVYLHAGRR